MSYVDFYHYTNRSAANSINASQVIESTSNFAQHGIGVYGTKLPPSAGKEAIAFNNWRGGGDGRQASGRVDYCFKVRIPSSEVKEKVVDSGRHLYLYEGDLRLNNYQWECINL